MRTLTAVILVLALALAGVGLWYFKFRHQVYGVEEVLSRARSLNGKVICVKGRVGRPLSALVAGYFRLEGRSQAVLHVVTQGSVPPSGKEVTVCGTFQQAYHLGPLTVPVLLVP
ncbi:MAG: hypothetical protein DSZ24_04270 [Thermodesulfatator sp.]|nr:MAG: hypothetical protein DSZ24_04270 [Thermodesulfatator sp.]